ERRRHHIAPPKPVMPRTAPAAIAIAAATISVAGSMRARGCEGPTRRCAALRRYRQLGSGEADARMVDVLACGKEADELGKRRRAETAFGYGIAQLRDELLVVERREQHVLVARRGAEFAAKTRYPWLDVCGGRFGDVFVVANVRPFEKLVRWTRREAAVIAARIFADLVRNGLVALALHDVQRCLRHDVLRERAYGDRIAQVPTHPRRFVENLREAVGDSHRLELIVQIGDHSAGDLVLVERPIVRRDLAARLVL